MLNRGMQLKRKLWSQAGQRVLRELPLEGWAAQRRRDLLQLLASLDERDGKIETWPFFVTFCTTLARLWR